MLNDCIRNTTAIYGNVATVGYNYVHANSDRLMCGVNFLNKSELIITKHYAHRNQTVSSTEVLTARFVKPKSEDLKSGSNPKGFAKFTFKFSQNE